jgi:hypothetical protein
LIKAKEAELKKKSTKTKKKNESEALKRTDREKNTTLKNKGESEKTVDEVFKETVNNYVKFIKLRLGDNTQKIIKNINYSQKGDKYKKFEEILTDYVAEITKSYNDLDENSFGKFENFTKLEKLYIELKPYVELLPYMKHIDDRNVEGEYINSSLADLRQDVKYILNKRNSKCLYCTPVVDSNCIEQYCPTLSNCFNSAITKDYKYNEIMEWVMGENKTTTFEDDCILSVFCVFNVTENRNDPAIMPYIDINEFRQTLDKINNVTVLDSVNGKVVEIVEKYRLKPWGNAQISNIFDSTYKVKDLNSAYESKLNEIKEQDRLLNNSKNYATNFETIMKPFINAGDSKRNPTNLREANYVAKKKEYDEWFEIKETAKDAVNGLKGQINKDVTKKLGELVKLPKDATKEYTDLITELKAKFETIKKFIGEQAVLVNRIALIAIKDSLEYTKLIPIIENAKGSTAVVVSGAVTTIGQPSQEFINLIDKYNASTDIGTIAYLDNFKNSNTIEIVCKKNSRITEDNYQNAYSTDMVEIQKNINN